MQGLFRRAVASIAALVLLAPQAVGISSASSPHRSSNRAYVALASPPQRIPVKEPARVKPSPSPEAAIRPKLVQGIRAHGVRLNGPPMLRPGEIDRVISAARRHTMQIHPANAPLPVPRSVPQTPGRGVPQTPNVAPPGTRRALSLPSDPAASGTGINPWWRYQEQNLPGGGRLMVNVGTGNLLLQDDDMAVPHKGIAMAFRRTYNSQMPAVVPGNYTNWTSLFGNGWTNTFDAHLVMLPNGDKVVYDIDGARYYYQNLGGGPAVFASSTPGQHATLVSDGVCGLMWTKKSGTVYYFYSTVPTKACPAIGTVGGYSGRLYQIVGRNRNTYVTFTYSWDNGDASVNGKVSGITATTESGMTATLSFADFNGRRLLQQLTYPDGATSVTYDYDAAGNLTVVSRPPNNGSGTRPIQSFGYASAGTDSILSWAASPRWHQSGPSDGAYLAFYFNGNSAASSTLASILHRGVVNPVISDGTNTQLQPGYSTSAMLYLADYYTTGVTTPTFRDTDGHMANWVVDGAGRPTQSQECTASTSQGQSCVGLWLTSNESWDTDNNLISSTDVRGNETDYSYDAMGNATEVGEPLTQTSAGIFKPTRLYDYDAHNNVVGFCDEIATHAAGLDWNGAGTTSDSSCVGRVSSPHWHATYTYPSYEPYGQLATMVSPLGYTRAYSYSAAQQGGADYGLPTTVTGDSFTQVDGTTSTPTQTFWYDGSGNLGCYSKGNGIYVLAYNSLGRLVSEADPDDSSANAASGCGKTTGQSGWNTQTTYSYFADGAKASTQTPSERAFGVSTTYTYDLDGNVQSETEHHGCVAGSVCAGGTTIKWYDGADRLVEVQQAPAASDTAPWITRYLYDLTAGGTVTISGSSVAYRAYGNLYKTQTWAPGPSMTSWLDKQGSAFDALDREVQKYSYRVSPSSVGSGALELTQLTYDAGSPATLGLLTQKTNPNSESVTYTYDALGRPLSKTYAGDNGVTPSATYVYDPSGRKVSATSTVFGTEQYSYDADGRLRQLIEPTGGGITGAAQLTYSYYGNGRRSSVSVTSPELTVSNVLAYSYRADGSLQTQVLNGFGNATWNRAYTDAGRLLTVSGIDTQRLSYDATGQLTSQALNSGTLTFAHDPEGSVEVTTVPNIYPSAGGSPVTETLTNTLNSRGELVGEHWSPNTPPAFPEQTGTTTAGYLSMLSDPAPSDGPPTSCEDNADHVNGVRVDLSCPGTAVSFQGQTYPQGSDDRFAFDATGRQTVHTKTTDTALISQMPPPHDAVTVARGTHTVTTITNTYNAENHLASIHPVVVTTRTSSTSQPTTTTSDRGTSVIGWGSNDHPALLQPGNGTGPMTLHWDGDMVLFVTDAAGNLIDFKAGLDGEVEPRDANFSGITAYDRDPAGLIIASNNSTGTSGMQPWDPSLAGANSAPTPGFKVGGAYMWYLRSDGFQIGTGVFGAPAIQINGGRAFDSTLGTWTTPDAYEGDIRDPASQQRYMFNRNNAYDYGDPDGFDPNPIMLPAGVHRPPSGIEPVNENPFSNQMRDIFVNGLVATTATTGLGMLIDGANLTRGGFIGAAASIAWAMFTDKGIAPGYYVQTIMRDSGTATTIAIYRAPMGSQGSFWQQINFQKNGAWEAQTVYDTGRVEKQSGPGTPHTGQDIHYLCSSVCFGQWHPFPWLSPRSIGSAR